MRNPRIININGIELISYKDAPYFLFWLYEKGSKLLGYDFFIYSPSLWILPDITLSENFSDSTFSDLERIWMSLLNILDIDSIKNELTSMNRDELTPLLEWGLKYLNGEETDVIVWYEFVYVQ